MGIKGGFSRFIQRKFPEAFEEVRLDELGPIRIAIDVPIYINRFIATSGTRWEERYIRFLWTLWDADITPVLVVDGESLPEKLAEVQSRRASARATERHVDRVAEQLIQFEQGGVVGDDLARFAGNMGAELTEGDIQSGTILRIRAHIRKKRWRATSWHFARAREIAVELGFTFVVAQDEAEMYCAWLNKLGYVDAVLSDDTDTFALTCPTILCRVRSSMTVCTRIHMPTLLDAMGLTEDQMRALCILCGTDYNTNIAGIGHTRAYDLVRHHANLQESLDAVPNSPESIRVAMMRSETLFTRTFTEPDDAFPLRGCSTWSAPFNALWFLGTTP